MILFWCVSVFLLAWLSMVCWNVFSGPPENIGVVDQKLHACPDSPNCVCSQDDRPSHEIAPLTYTGSPDAALQQLADILKQQPGCRIVQNEEDYLRAEFRSRWFRFVDDIEFLVNPDQNVIQVRSASRVGYSDLGVNRKRIENLRKQFADAND